MARRLRSTLRGKWWSDFFEGIRHCYFCGSKLIKKFVREEKKRRHVCGGCERITYVNPRVVAGFIPIMRDGRVALLKREFEPAKGRWTYPAGFQEMGESTEAAAVRETLEEIQARVKIKKTVGLYSYADAGVVTMVYAGPIVGKAPQAGQEALEVRLFKISEIPWKKLAFRSTKDALKDWIKAEEKLQITSPKL